jgi:GPH family glycoside/pentoside/hexuronide:cation symporter
MTASIPVALGTRAAPGARLRVLALVAYGLLGMPLAMAALPLYVHLPKFYGAQLGVSLTALGALLLVLRLADGILDPLLGAWSDRVATRKRPIALAAPFLALGMVALFSPPVSGQTALLWWLGGSLTLVYFAFSLATVNHGAWGAELSTDPVERTRITAVRESLALLGVVIASVAPGLLGSEDAGLPRFAWVFAFVCLACVAVTLSFAPAAPHAMGTRTNTHGTRVFADLAQPLSDHSFRRLLAVFMANGIASAIPATLVLFFIADVLAADDMQGAFLALYFIAGAAGMPLWVKLSARFGKVRAWQAAMLIAVVAFVWAAFLGTGDTVAFAFICAASGLALGADLALPPSLLADVIGRHGTMRSTGAYFGLWTLATKLNLALAAGVALPLLALLGYAPGSRDASALAALAFVYAGVPCVLKLGALTALSRFNAHWKIRNA